MESAFQNKLQKIIQLITPFKFIGNAKNPATAFMSRARCFKENFPTKTHYD